MSLATYQHKRDFKKTAEPPGRRRAAHRTGLHYVIQKHDASRLHYDFRLELDGLLKSWAVPKGPSLDPSRKVLAVQVEDHPLDYESFEGIIPQGQYGGGTVMLWDRGTWEPLEDPHTGLAAGKLRFQLHGQRLRGIWSLVRMHGPSNGTGKNWLLVKSRDDYSTTDDVLANATSIQTQRTMDQIATDADAIWNFKEESHPAPRKRHPPRNLGTDPMPERISPQLATLSQHPPEGDDWLHEIKFDGYRLLAFLKNGSVTLRTRTSQDWTSKFLPLVGPLKKLHAASAILDGEVVVLNPQGRSDFALLQTSFKNKDKVDLHYCVFDLLYLDGHDLRDLPLLERKQKLHQLLQASGSPRPIDFSDHVLGQGASVLRKACDLGTEGIISKRAAAPYVSRRDPSWLKSKCVQSQEFVIIGYIRSSRRPDGLRSLLLGLHDPPRGLVYCGRVGTGFDETLRRSLLEKFPPLARDDPPTALPPPRREQAAAHWLKPELVCAARFQGWTRDGVLRHPVFIALRLDKPAQEITREVPMTTETTRKKTTTKKSPPKTTKNGHASTPHDKAPLNQPAAWAGITLTHPDKLLFPADHLRKRDLADYYQLAAPFMLPHITERPLALKRCPDGITSTCFFQRNWSATLPPSIDKVKVDLGKHESHVMIHDAAGLFSLVQISALEIHTWNCNVDDLHHPDQLVFDLDPGPAVTWKQVVAAARLLRDLLHTLGLTSFLKTSGGKGLHLTVPILPTVDWARAKAFSKTLAEHAVQQHDLFITNMRKDLRHGRIYLDYLRNGEGATAIAPYSSRARPGAAVSMPLAWDDLGDLPSADHFTLKNAAAHLARRRADPWRTFADARVDLHKIVQPTATSNAKE